MATSWPRPCWAVCPAWHTGTASGPASDKTSARPFQGPKTTAMICAFKPSSQGKRRLTTLHMDTNLRHLQKRHPPLRLRLRPRLQVLHPRLQHGAVRYPIPVEKKNLTNLDRIRASSGCLLKYVVCCPLDLAVIICRLRHVDYRGLWHFEFLQRGIWDHHSSQQQRRLFIPIKLRNFQELIRIFLCRGEQHLSQ